MNEMAKKKGKHTGWEPRKANYWAVQTEKRCRYAGSIKDIFGPMFEAMLQGEMNGFVNKIV